MAATTYPPHTRLTIPKGEHFVTVLDDGVSVSIDCHDQTHRGEVTATARSAERACKIITDRYTPNAWMTLDEAAAVVAAAPQTTSDADETKAQLKARNKAHNEANAKIREEAEAGRANRKAAGRAKTAEVPARDTRTRRGQLQIIRRTPNQVGVPDGHTKWFCSACMASFIGEPLRPFSCPQGHSRVADAEVTYEPDEAVV